MMRTDAGLHADQAQRHVGKPRLVWVVLIRPKRWERYGLKPWIVLLRCISPLVALNGGGQGVEFTSAFGGAAEVYGPAASDAFDANDPSPTLATDLAVRHNARSTCYTQLVFLGLGEAHEAMRIHRGSRRRGGSVTACCGRTAVNQGLSKGSIPFDDPGPDPAGHV
jgi:hypothetical protein